MQNTRSPLGKYTKEPMKLVNKERCFAFMLKAESYIRSLTDSNGQNILTSRRKTGFLGFLSNIQAYKSMFEQLVEGGLLKYLLTYKTSQDHLELFFGAIRSRNGKNDNPTAIQFCSAYKSLLMHGTMKGKKIENKFLYVFIFILAKQLRF
jgi:hypothetical protein